MKDRIGTHLNRYLLLELLGEGGMGAVFKARDETLQRFVAVKVLHSHFASQPKFQERFLREARAAAAMDHPGIVKVFDFGQSDDLLYIVMEFIPGSNLRELLRGLRETGRQMPIPVAVELGLQVCLAVDYAHRQGVLHRDIKPDNIMLKLGGTGVSTYQPVLTDLGLARLLDEQSITQAGESMGTPAYMSPEQAMGEATDARSDVYALGVMLFELVTGQVPFPAKTITEAIRYHTREPVPSPTSINSEIPSPLEAVILKALEKDPSNRFPDAGSLAQALERSLTLQVDIPAKTVVETQAESDIEVPVTIIPATQIDQGTERTEVTLASSLEAIKPGHVEKTEDIPQVESKVISDIGSEIPLFHCVIFPEESSSGEMVWIEVQNKSKDRQTYRINFIDQADTLTFDPPQITLDIAPGQQAEAEFQVEEVNTNWYGGKKLYPYSIEIQASNGETKTVNRRMISYAKIPAWLPPVVLLFIFTLVLIFSPKPFEPPSVLPTAGLPATYPPTIFPTPTTDPWASLDDDGDGLSNGQEVEYGLDPKQPLGGGTGWIAFQQESNDRSSIIKTNAGSTRLLQLYDDISAYYPGFSPDGQLIAFLLYTANPNNPEEKGLLVHVMDSNGGSIQLVSDRPSNNSRPSWSPDTKRIIDAGLAGLYTVGTDGVNVEEIEVDINVSDPVWSPDGQWIAFSSFVNTDNRDIYKMKIDGSNLTRLTTMPGRNITPDWSPDGQQIAFSQGSEWGLMDIYTMNSDGSKLKQLTWNPRNDWAPAWSPDGEWIAFSGDGEIYIVKSDGSLELKVTEKMEEEYHSYPTWQPLPIPSASTPTITQFPTLTITQTGSTGFDFPSIVLWDLSHGPRQSSEIDKLYEPDGLYSQLKAELEKNNITLVSNWDPLEQIDLSKFAMIAIAMSSAQKQFYTDTEAEIIGDFVKQGGNLLILAENPDFPNYIQKVIGYYGINVGEDTISKAVMPLDDHPIFRNVDEIIFGYGGGSITVNNSQARVIGSQNGKAAIVVIEDLPGRVVVVGDSNLFDNRSFLRNKQFAINLFNWLTQR